MSSSLLAVLAARAADASAPSAAAVRRNRQRRRRQRELTRLDALLDDIFVQPADNGSHRAGEPHNSASGALLSRLLDFDGQPLLETGSATCLSWDSMAPSCDPCRLECHASARMAVGQPRGDRKRETVSAYAWLLECVILPHILKSRGGGGGNIVTIVDAGSSTGSL